MQTLSSYDNEKRPDGPFLYSSQNHLDFGDMPDHYKYRGHIVHFLRDVGKLHKELPLILTDLDVVILRPAGAASDPAMDRQSPAVPHLAEGNRAVVGLLGAPSKVWSETSALPPSCSPSGLIIGLKCVHFTGKRWISVSWARWVI